MKTSIIGALAVAAAVSWPSSWRSSARRRSHVGILILIAVTGLAAWLPELLRG